MTHTHSPLTVGSIAPDFTLFDQHGKQHTLSDHRGSWVLIYFYPKDDTSGCTVEACGIRDNLPNFKKLNVTVFGISADTIESHDKFSKKFDLNFTLLADDSKKVVNEYGVWQEKNMMGKKYMGIVRWSFLVDPKGKIAKIYENVKPPEHADMVLADLTELSK